MSESAPSAIRVEKVLIGLLPDLDSLTELVKEGLPAHVLPTEDLRPVYEWAVRYYGQSSKAPTPMALKERFGEDFFSDREIDLEDEPEESVEWAIETLKSNYIRTNAQRLAKDLVTSIRDASPEDRLEALNAFASEASAMALDLTPSVQVADLRESALDMVLVHDQRAELGDGVRGMAWGLEEIDAHYSGIHPGELAVLAAPSKVGKSFMLTWSALKNWEAGRPGILHTLENSRQMTEMRIACQALHLDYNALEQGKLSQEDRSTLLEWIEDVLLESDTPLIISSPDHRTPHSLIQQARAMEAQWVSIDQLNFVEPTRPRRDQNTPQELFQIMRDFKNLINGRHPLAMMIAHQIKREGIKNAEKTGWLTMTDMADSAGVERTADFVFGLYGSDDMRRSGGMQFQGLAARRAPLASYDLHWQPAIGGIAVRNEVDFDVSEYL